MRKATCDTARARVSLQLDGELSQFEASLLERHIRRCGACAAFADGVRFSTELLRTAPLEPAPQLWLARRAVATRTAARVAAVTAAAAAAVLVALSSVSLQPGGRTSAGFGLWPTGLAVHPAGDENLGVQRVAFETPSPGGPRRGLLSA